MIDEFLKKLYIKVKELFTETENPLYKQFYGNETGFENFKSHAEGDYTLFWIYKRESFTDDDVQSSATEIIRRINRYYHISGQAEIDKQNKH